MFRSSGEVLKMAEDQSLGPGLEESRLGMSRGAPRIPSGWLANSFAGFTVIWGVAFF